MKQNQCITFSGTRTTSSQVCHWAQCLFELHTRIAPRFTRPEPHRQVLAYLKGILRATSCAKTDGIWPNALEKPVLTGCNGCSRMPFGTLMGSVMTCATLWWSNWGVKRP